MQADEGVTDGRESAWYVIHTKPRQEEVARENLARQGFDAYLPRQKVLKGRCHPQRIGFEPLFPRYLFFRPSHIEQSIAPVRSTKGVKSMVRFGGVSAALCPSTLESIRVFESRQNAANIDQLRALRPGSEVVVMTGPLAGLQGLVAMASSQRVIVLMRLLGEGTRVTLSSGDLRLAA